MSGGLLRVRAIARKELLQAARDPLSLALLLGVPALMLLLYGYAINFDVRHVSLGVQDRDRSAHSRALVAAFVHSGYFDLRAELGARERPEDLTARRTVKLVLVVPNGYARTLETGGVARVQLLADGADANTATTALGYAAGLVEGLNAARRAESAGRVERGRVAYEPRVFYNPELRSTQFLVPGLTGFILMLTAVISTALSVVREKERGTMEQLLVTALRPHELLLGKTAPYLLISLGATLVLLGAARVLFGVVVRGSYLDLFLATLLYLVGALGWGLLVSTLAESQAMAFQIGVVSSMLPAIFLSGFIFPIRGMPEPVQWLTHLVPARYFLVVLRGIVLKGAGLVHYPRDMALLLVYATLVLALAYLRLRRREL